ncbi:hypothetical protein LT493_19380 [Streptomyces tricolor]|nr:hypothetical protein [Streptomyces tricolor]
MQRRLDAARTRDRLTADLAQARQHAQAARQRALDARAHWLDLKEQRLSGIAAELAAHLTDGEPCAVCGATEHPAPARKESPDTSTARPRTVPSPPTSGPREQHSEDERRLGAVREALAAATAEAGDTPPTGSRPRPGNWSGSTPAPAARPPPCTPPRRSCGGPSRSASSGSPTASRPPYGPPPGSPGGTPWNANRPRWKPSWRRRGATPTAWPRAPRSWSGGRHGSPTPPTPCAPPRTPPSG